MKTFPFFCLGDIVVVFVSLFTFFSCVCVYVLCYALQQQQKQHHITSYDDDDVQLWIKKKKKKISPHTQGDTRYTVISILYTYTYI